jgi:hypothetical protein
MVLEEQRMDEIKKILLQHKGKTNAIAANKISKMLNIPEDDTVPTTRKIITKLIIDEGMPIGAFGNGYFYIETPEELADYMQFLQDKIEQTTTRKVIVYNNYVMKYGKIRPKITKLDDF